MSDAAGPPPATDDAPPAEVPLPGEPRVLAGGRARRWLLLLGVLAVSVLLDQVTKDWAQVAVQTAPGRTITLVPGYLAFTYVRNPGAAWGFLAGADSSFRRPFFIGVSVLAMLFIVFVYRKLEVGQAWLMGALALILGGATGNFIDRVRQDYVVDFLDVHLRHHFYWPKFNVADIGISVGVAMLLLEMLLGPWWRRRRARRSGVLSPEL